MASIGKETELYAYDEVKQWFLGPFKAGDILEEGANVLEIEGLTAQVKFTLKAPDAGIRRVRNVKCDLKGPASREELISGTWPLDTVKDGWRRRSYGRVKSPPAMKPAKKQKSEIKAHELREAARYLKLLITKVDEVATRLEEEEGSASA